jgi:hypothetical protein
MEEEDPMIRKIAQDVEGHLHNNFVDPGYSVCCMKHGYASHFMKLIWQCHSTLKDVLRNALVVLAAKAFLFVFAVLCMYQHT